MSKAGTAVLAASVTAVGIVASFAALNAESQPFAIQMSILTLGCVVFLIGIWRRSAA